MTRAWALRCLGEGSIRRGSRVDRLSLLAPPSSRSLPADRYTHPITRQRGKSRYVSTPFQRAEPTPFATNKLQNYLPALAVPSGKPRGERSRENAKGGRSQLPAGYSGFAISLAIGIPPITFLFPSPSLPLSPSLSPLLVLFRGTARALLGFAGNDVISRNHRANYSGSVERRR